MSLIKKMKINTHIIFFKLILIILICTAISCVKEEDSNYFTNTPEVISKEKASCTALETEVLNLVNAHRQSMGISSLSLLNSISGVAVGHTNYMINISELNHDYFAQRTQYLMSNENAKSVGENVAYGYATAQGVLNGWLNSDAHRKVIENEKFTHIGISIEPNSENRNYYTQIFISK